MESVDENDFREIYDDDDDDDDDNGDDDDDTFASRRSPERPRHSLPRHPSRLSGQVLQDHRKVILKALLPDYQLILFLKFVV